jgi:hypothetical protein
MSSLIDRKPAYLGCVIGLMMLVGASAVSAETLLEPKRDYLLGASEVVWGVTTQANGTAFVLDYGDGSAQQTGTVADRSYIAFNHTFAGSGPLTIQLCVGAGASIPGCTGELATVAVNVFNPLSLTPTDLRGLNINRAIQDGLRFFWQNQTSRAANFPASPTTNWPLGYSQVEESLIVLAFENHGYLLPNDDSVPTGVYEKYVVRRGLNNLINNLTKLTIDTTPNGGDPCAGAGIEPHPCTGLLSNATGLDGYEQSIAILPLSGSNALSRHVAEITGTGSAGFVVGKTYGEVLQRMVDAMAWGQIDVLNTSRGGWGYTFNSGTADGSTLGWNMLALLDAGPQVTVPSFVKTEFSSPGNAGPTMSNSDGTFDYNPASGASPGGDNLPNMARVGVGLQANFYMGNIGAGNPAVDAGVNAASLRWVSISGLPSEYTATCGGVTTNNKGCAYAMFNVFKGLKLQGITSLPAVAAPPAQAHPAIADWYAEYVDFLVSTQTSPTTQTGGQWGSLLWSCCGGTSVNGISALAELILAPVTLTTPDPGLFSTVGLSPATATNPRFTDHTVTALVQSSSHAPIAGATVGFKVLTGPNMGASGTCVPASCISGADGTVMFTYHDTAGVGHDTIQANIGPLLSNIVDKFWIIPAMKCDANSDGVVDMTDLAIIRAANGQVASGPTDPRDGNSDGVINVLDVRYCQLRLTPPK